MEITIKWTVDSKSDEEAKNKVKVLFNAAYGDLVTSEDMHPEDELHPMDEVIQDLKLENDRLKQRDEIMLQFIGDLYDKAINGDVTTKTEYIGKFYDLRERLEAL